MRAGLSDLVIRGVGVIEEAVVEFGPGLTVITGETGAGKTMVLTGLSMILGGPSDPGLVRDGHDSAVVEGSFLVVGQTVRDLVDEAGGSLDEDGSLIVSRQVTSRRSRAFLGGRTVPAATLAEIGTHLLAVHGQDDQHRLLRPAQQRAALDRFGGRPLADVRTAYQSAYDELLDVTRRRDEVTAQERERSAESQTLAEALDAIDRVRPEPGEEQALRAQSVRMAHLDDIVRASVTAREALAADERGAVDALGVATAALGRAAEADPALAAMRERSAQLASEADELAVDLARYLDDLDADPEQAARVEDRRAVLGDLRRMLERTGAWPHLVSDPHAWAEAARARHAELDDDAGLIESLTAQRLELLERAGRAAAELSALRQLTARGLSGAVTAELKALAMGAARVDVVVQRRVAGSTDLDLVVDGAASGADRHGVDEVEFLLASRDGAPARPIARSASGGERSRIMLALEVVFAGLDPVPTFVFDEVDAGVGGKAAVEVGHRLALLARHAQVIVVTHLAQVAAFADRHLVVRPGAVTSSSVQEATGEARVTELARMLAGLEESESAAAHAVELLDLAAARAQDAAQVPAGRSAAKTPKR